MVISEWADPCSWVWVLGTGPQPAGEAVESSRRQGGDGGGHLASTDSRRQETLLPEVMEGPDLSPTVTS